MKKHHVIFGLAVFFSMAAARADTANVNVYGTFNVSFESVKATGPKSTDPIDAYVSRFRLASNSSNIGFKVSENLSDSLKAFLQIESSVDPGLASFGTWGVRNTGIGFAGGYGTLIMGHWDTPFKLSSSFMEPFYSTGVGYMAAILDSIGGAKSSTFGTDTPLAFSRRQLQSVQYWSPAFGGMSLKAVYSSNLKRDASGNPDLFGATLAYMDGPLNASVSYEQHDDFGARSSTGLPPGGTGKNTKDTGVKIAAGYKFFEALSLGAAWSSITLKANETAGTAEYKRNAFAVTAMHKLSDAITLRLGYGKADDGTCKKADGSACSEANKYGANLLAAGASYSLSGRTDIYGIYSRISNNEDGTYNFAVSGLDTVKAGSDPTSVAFGVRHSF